MLQPMQRPPLGWEPFGSNAGDELGGWSFELSAEVDNEGMPLWERKVRM